MTDLQRRTRQTILLLTTLLDVTPGPTTWTGNLVQRAALPGPAPSRWQTCTTCDGAGHQLDRFKRPTPCEQCNGHGRYKVDDYTHQRVSTLEAGLITHTTTVRCDRCNGEGAWKFQRCTLCEGTGRRTATTRELTASHDTTPRGNDNDLWGRTGSYHELDRELRVVKAIDPYAHRQVWDVYVAQTLIGNLSADWPIIQGTVAFITYRMPNPIIVPPGISAADKRAQAHRLKIKGRHIDARALQARNQEIRKLARQDKPVQWIAQQAGLSPSSVYDIIRGQEIAA